MIKVITGKAAYVNKKVAAELKDGSYIVEKCHTHPNGDITVRLTTEPSKRHGSPYDRGSADAYYGRSFNPHYYVGATSNSTRINAHDMSEKEISDYIDGYDNQTERKEYSE